MIRFNFKKLLSEKEFKEQCRIPLKEISDAIGISKATLSSISNSKKPTSTDIVEKLCLYFDCSPNDLMTIIPDQPDKKEGD